MEYEQLLEQNDLHELITLAADEKTSPREITVLIMSLKRMYVQLFLLDEGRFREKDDYIHNGSDELDRQAGIKIEVYSGRNFELEYGTPGIFHLGISVPKANNPILLKSLATFCHMIYDN